MSATKSDRPTITFYQKGIEGCGSAEAVDPPIIKTEDSESNGVKAKNTLRAAYGPRLSKTIIRVFGFFVYSTAILEAIAMFALAVRVTKISHAFAMVAFFFFGIGIFPLFIPTLLITYLFPTVIEQSEGRSGINRYGYFISRSIGLMLASFVSGWLISFVYISLAQLFE